jgi:hypothetical protein
MFFKLGQEVVLKFTGDKGKISEIHSDGMVIVYVAGDDMYIPVYEEDLTLPSAFKGIENEPKNSKVKPTDAELFPIKTQYNILTSLGIQLAFEEIRKHDDIEKYKIYLINDTNDEAIFVFKLKIEDKNLMEVDGKTERLSVLLLGEMFYDELNDSPVADMEISRITTEGLEPVIHKSLKIKAKQFFNSVLTAPLLNKTVHHFVFFPSLLAEDKAKKEEDLKAYTIRASVPLPKVSVYNPTEITPFRTKNDIKELSEFSPEIDLHIENLTTNYKGLSNSQILTIQVAHFERFMQKAIRLGVERVFIIHGIGKGKLRDAITTRLLQEFDFHSFKNEYHPRYGFGATEIIL